MGMIVPNERKRALMEYQLKAAKEFKKASDRKYGKLGAASRVRHIDTTGYIPPQPKPESFLPRGEVALGSAKRRWLSRQAGGITGIKIVSLKQTFNRYTRQRES